MQPNTNRVVIGALVAVAILAVAGWWRAIGKGGELEAARAQAAQTEAGFNTRVATLTSENEARVAAVTAEGETLKGQLKELTDRRTALEQEVAELQKLNGDVATARQVAEKARGESEAATAALNAQLQTLKDREQQAAQAEVTARERSATLAGIERRLEEGGKQLTARLGALGARERETIDLERKIGPLTAAVTAAEARLPELQAQVSERLGVLGQREQELAQLEGQMGVARHQADRLRAELGELEPRLNQVKTDLGQTEALLTDKRRQLDDAQKRLAEANTALEQVRRLVAN